MNVLLPYERRKMPGISSFYHGMSETPQSQKHPSRVTNDKFYIMSTEFDKNISDWSHDCTDHENGIGFFMRLFKWPKIAVKKSQKFQKF